MNITAPTTLSAAQYDGLAELLIDVINAGGSVGFFAPLQKETALEYWRQVKAEMESGLVLFIAEMDGVIVGSVQLAPSPKANGQHRAEVRKLISHTDYRGKGIASRLMQAVEDHALACGKTLLVLDTHLGRPAEAIYQHLGWTRVVSFRTTPPVRTAPCTPPSCFTNNWPERSALAPEPPEARQNAMRRLSVAHTVRAFPPVTPEETTISASPLPPAAPST